MYEGVGVKNHSKDLPLKCVTRNSHGQNDECGVNNKKKLSKKDLKSTSRESFSSKSSIFYSRVSPVALASVVLQYQSLPRVARNRKLV